MQAVAAVPCSKMDCDCERPCFQVAVKPRNDRTRETSGVIKHEPADDRVMSSVRTSLRLASRRGNLPKPNAPAATTDAMAIMAA